MVVDHPVVAGGLCFQGPVARVVVSVKENHLLHPLAHPLVKGQGVGIGIVKHRPWGEGEAVPKPLPPSGLRQGKPPQKKGQGPLLPGLEEVVGGLKWAQAKRGSGPWGRGKK